MSVHRHQPRLGSLLRESRLAAGLSQEALAERSGVSLRTIQQIEADRVRPRRATCSLLADALQLDGPARDALLRLLRPATHRFVPAAPGGGDDGRPTAIRSIVPLHLRDGYDAGVGHGGQIVARRRPTPNNIPHPVSSLLGREADLTAIRRQITADRQRLVTLLGVGGAGKTRLAVQVADDLLGDFGDGVWLVELAPVADPVLVPRVVASALSVPEVMDTPILDTLLESLRAKHALLVLDNCEHLIDVCASLAERLLGACPNLHILVTSREPLRIDGEQRWQVRPLAVPPRSGATSFDALARSPAVRLFVERAQGIDADFALTEANAGDVGRICTLLDGIPLAIELAASQVNVLDPGQIATRLEAGLRILAGGRRRSPIRQHTMEAALDWSHDLLAASEQVLFRRLSTFAGGFDLEAAAVVGGAEPLAAPEILSVLGLLVDRSLVAVEQGPAARRYRLLEPVRQYAHQLLMRSDEDHAARARHAGYYAGLMERTAPLLRGPEQIAWLDRIESERDNVRAALGWVMEHGPADAGLRLGTALSPYWEARGYLSEGRNWLERMLDASRGRAFSPGARLAALVAAGRLAFWQVDHAQAEVRLTEAVALARDLSDRRAEGEALAWLSAVHWQHHAAERGLALGEESLRLGRELADEGLIALALLTVGISLHHVRDVARAVSLLDESLAQHRRLGDVRYAAIAATCLAWSTLETGDHERAALALRESILGLQRVRDQRFIVIAVRCLVMIARSRGEARRAVELLGASDALRTSLGLRRTPHAVTNDQKLRASLEGSLTALEFDEAYAAGAALEVDEVFAEIVAVS